MEPEESESEEEPEPEKTKEPEPEKTKEPEPTKTVSPEQQIENATDAENAIVDTSVPGIVMVAFEIDDGMTKKLTAFGAKKDSIEILEAVHGSDLEYDKVFLNGKFEMRNEFGEINERVILNVGYEPDTLERIQFDDPLVIEDIWTIADQSFVHAELED